MAGATFQIVDLTVSDTDRPGLWPSEREGRQWGRLGSTRAALLLFGRTLDGESVMVSIRGVELTMHVRFPEAVRHLTYDRSTLPASLQDRDAELRDALSQSRNGVELAYERRVPLGGYGSGRSELFLAVRAKSTAFYYRARDAVTDLGAGYEVVGPGRTFLRETVVMADLGWEFSSLLTLAAGLPARCLPHGDVRRSTCDHEVWLNAADVPGLLAPAADQLASVPVRVASFDIEASAPGGGFPNPLLMSDAIVCLAIHYGPVDDPEADAAVVLCLDPESTGWGRPAVGRYECFQCERELIDRFAELAIELDVDVFTGYNIYGFDWLYLWRRAGMVGAEGLRRIGRLKDLDSDLEEKQLSSSALGDNTIYQVRGLGRVSVDMMHQIRPNYKFASYSLEFVSQKLLGGDGKNPMPYALIPMYASGAEDARLISDALMIPAKAKLLVEMAPDEYAALVGQISPRERNDVVVHIQGRRKAPHRRALAARDVAARDVAAAKPAAAEPAAEPADSMGRHRRMLLADYCRQDCVLPMRLMRLTGTVQGLLAMSRVTHTSLHNLLTRGQQIKVFAQIYRGARSKGYVMTAPPDVYCVLQGATVLTPIQGVCLDPVATLDFASLYPNCFRVGNLCYSTFISIRDVDDPEPSIPLEDRKDVFTSAREIVSCVRPHVRPGILPMIVTEVLMARKATRAEQKHHAHGTPQWTNLEKRQLALKISANSMYGVLGVVDGAYSLPPLAAATTALGRLALEITQRLCREEMTDLVGRIMYGDTDSVMVELLVDRGTWEAEKPRPGDDGDPRRLYPSPGIRQAFRMGQELEARLNRRIAEVTESEFLVLEFEQLFDVCCFLSPKRYMGSRWTGVERSCGLYLKGVQSERRDASAPQRDALRGAMGALMYSDSSDPLARVEAAVHAVQRALQRFLDGDVPFEDYVMTKSLRDHYKVPNAKGAHLTVVKKMRARAPGSEPKPGNRVPYVICANGRAKSGVSEKAEDPDWAADHEMRPDRVFYAQLMLNAMEQMLDPLLSGGVSVAKVAAPYLHRMAAQDSGAKALGAPPKTIQLAELPRGPPPKLKRQATLVFSVVPRTGPRPIPTPTARPAKKRREARHPTLQFKPAPE